ncbi:MAG: XrtA-associated ATPase [Sphingomonadales bacterium]|nr:XrtA-associated ATPase [Sphingomonadales bacterium]
MYDQFYGLSGRPFQLTPDPQYYFESGTHRKALSYLGYGLAQGEGFIVITGEVGSGKSTLVGHLMQTIDRARLTAATIVTSQLDAVDLVQMVAESYGIDTRGLDKASALKAIENFLHAEARAGRRCLLVVDEAQNLAIDALEELRMLSNFQLGSMPLLQIFLLGQPEFRDLLKTAPELEQLRQRVIATHHLEAMDADEVQPYVQHRLRKAGWTGRPQLSDDAYAALYDETTGIPRKLNALMNRCLLMGAVEQIDVIDGPLVGAVIADMAGKPFAYEAPMSSQAPALAVDLPAVVVDAAEESADAIDSANVVAMPSHLAAVPTISAGGDVSLQARIAEMEVRMAEQDATMRRVLAMLIDWMEKENHSMAARMRDVRAA